LPAGTADRLLATPGWRPVADGLRARVAGASIVADPAGVPADFSSFWG
jgi:hypothetical protein